MGNYYSQFTTYASPSVVVTIPTLPDFNNFLNGTSTTASTIISEGITINPKRGSAVELFFAKFRPDHQS